MSTTERNFDGGDAAAILASLTSAQMQVMERVSYHFTSKEIARELGISAATVDQRVRAATAKLGASNRAEAARMFIELHRAAERQLWDNLASADTSHKPIFNFGDASGISGYVTGEAEQSAASSFANKAPSRSQGNGWRMGVLGRTAQVLLITLLVVILSLLVVSIISTIKGLLK